METIFIDEPKTLERITGFSPLSSGWFNHYKVNGEDIYRACPGILEVRTYDQTTGRNELISVVYIPAVFDQGELVGADELDGYQTTDIPTEKGPPCE